MRAIQFSGPGGPETITEVDIPVPVPGAGQVAIAVRYAGLNFVDVLARRGAPGYATGWPYVPGMEVAGEVVALGPGVAGFAVGDPVAAFTVDGGGLAAVLGLRMPAALTGGARPWAASTLAAAYRPAVRDADFAAAARKANDGELFDVVLESIGGDVSAAVAGLLAPGGRLVSYGAAAGQPDPAPPTYAELRRNNWTMTGFSISNRARADAGAVGDLIAAVFTLAGQGLSIPAPRIVDWNQAITAHVIQAEGRSPGKTVVAVRPSLWLRSVL